MVLRFVQLGGDITGIGLESEEFGQSVSISGDGSTVAIGSLGHPGVGGRVEVWRQSHEVLSVWEQIGTGIDVAGGGDIFPIYSVSLSENGSILAVGAAGESGVQGQYDHGQVKIYEYSETGSDWVQMGAEISGDSGSGSGENLGVSVSLSGDGKRVAIGANRNSDTDPNSLLDPDYLLYLNERKGQVQIYEYSETGNTWGQMGLNIYGDGRLFESGFSVSLSGDGTRVAMGERGVGYGGQNKTGRVRIFEYSETGDTWGQMGNPEGGVSPHDAAGTSVSLNRDGTRFALGAIGYDGEHGDLMNSGLARVFEYSGGAWDQMGADILGENSGDYLGISVSLSGGGDVLAVGAHRYDVNDESGVNMDAGQVRVLRFIDGVWETNGQAVFEGNDPYEHFGYSVSISSDGRMVAIGANKADINNEAGSEQHEAGRVEVYATACFTKDAVVKTDQGLVNINKITTKHTIDDQFINGISKTIHTQNKLVSIDPGAFGKNQPNKKTLVAPFHRFLVDSTLKMAVELVNNDTIYLVKYKEQPLYNILLEKLGTMEVNNVIVETLNPNSLVAKLFDGSLSTKQLSKLVKSFNAYHKNLKIKPNKTLRDYRV